MKEQRPPSLYQQQKAIKPLIEDLLPDFLDGDMKNSALDFVTFMRSNKIKPAWTLTNAWKAVCKGRCICYIHLGGGGAASAKNVKWVVTPYLEHINEYEKQILADGLQRFLWDNVMYCVNKPKDSLASRETIHYALKPPCNIWGCAPGKTKTICGMEFTNVCRNGNRQHFWFHDPDAESVEAIKRLLVLEKNARIENKNAFTS